MKIKDLNKHAVRSTYQVNKKLTTLSEDELNKVVAGLMGCTCAYKYATTMMALTTYYEGK